MIKSRNTQDSEQEGPTVDRTKGHSKIEIERAAFEEVNVSGFAHIDQEVAFFTQVAALIQPDHRLLDFGAGRGEFYHDDPAPYRRSLQSFRGRVAHVDGCDVDEAVKTNPTLDEAKTFKPGEPLPYADNCFDIVVSRYVFEHVSDPDWAARELLRVTKPGGWICALTPNKWGYVALAATVVPNRMHHRLLHKVQPHRRDEDVFPTVYRLNRPSAVRRHFGAHADVFHYSTSAVPSYHFGSVLVLRLLLVLHRFLPPALDTGLAFFMRKR